MISDVFRRLATILTLLLDKFSRQRDAKQEFLAAQIEILQKRLKTDHVKLSPEERRELLALGTRFDHQVDDFILVVKPGT